MILEFRVHFCSPKSKFLTVQKKILIFLLVPRYLFISLSRKAKSYNCYSINPWFIPIRLTHWHMKYIDVFAKLKIVWWNKMWNFAISFNWVLCWGCFLSIKFCAFHSLIIAVAPYPWTQTTFCRKVKEHNQNLGTKSFLDWYNYSFTPQFLQKNLWFLRPISAPGLYCFLEMIKSVKNGLKDYNLY